MSTNSSITTMNKEGKYVTVYCHWNGYLTNNGAILLENYKTQEDVERLISLGDMSSLAERIEPEADKPHSFDEPQSGVCVYYHRDRGEDWRDTMPIVCDELKEIYKFNKQEYNYFFKDGKWYWNIGYNENDWTEDGEPIWSELLPKDCYGD